MAVAGADTTTPTPWLGTTDEEFDALQQDAYWQLCEEPEHAPRHMMTIVLLEQLTALRAEVRDGRLKRCQAERAMRSDFARGYLAGLVATYIDSAGLAPDSPHVRAAWHDVLRLCFGGAEARGGGPLHGASGEFTMGEMAAVDDVRDFRAWLLGQEAAAAYGLRNGLLGCGRDPAREPQVLH